MKLGFRVGLVVALFTTLVVSGWSRSVESPDQTDESFQASVQSVIEDVKATRDKQTQCGPGQERPAAKAGCAACKYSPGEAPTYCGCLDSQDEFGICWYYSCECCIG